MRSIALIDYGLGNIRSITKAFEVYGVELKLTNEPDVIMACDSIVLPGVGAFAEGMNRLEELGLTPAIAAFADTGKPLLGICLGMQLLFDSSSEFGTSQGLGIIPGVVQRIRSDVTTIKKLPHVSWNSIAARPGVSWRETILDELEDSADMYFVHSYCAIPSNTSHVLSETNYAGAVFCSTVKKNNIYGCQYHPEKSSKDGLKIIENFIKLGMS